MAYSLTGGDNGSVTTVTNNADNGRTQTLTYDPLNRILKAVSQATSGTDCWGQTFGPDGNAADDAVGNFYKMNSGTQSNPPCTFGSLNVTVDVNNHVTGTSFAYDAVGNMTGDGQSGVTYTFDAEGRLYKVTGVTGGPWCYVYDGNGLRVAKKSGAASDCSGGTVTKLYWRSISGDALAETDGTGSTTNAAYNEYVFFSGRRIASRNGTGGIFYFFADQLGTTRTITTGNGPGQTSGQLCYDADFTPYGQEISYSARLQTTACPPNYRFTGYEFDSETGLNYAFARYYSARLGRFLSTDPLGGSVGDLQSHNAYVYTRNNPTNRVDTTGMVDCHPEEGCWALPDGNGGGPYYGPGNPGNGCAIADASCGFSWGRAGAWGGQAPWIHESAEEQRDEARYFSIITTGWDPELGIRYYHYSFSGGDGSIFESQKELAAIQLGQLACAGQGLSAIADCIQQIYNQLPSDPSSVPIEGGNYDFSYANILVNNQAINPSEYGCGRCGLFDTLDFTHGSNTFHVDTANPWFFPIGSVLHLFVDLVGGNTWWKGGIRRFP